jgi:peptidyl-prolyl cis-trans isomerase C
MNYPFRRLSIVRIGAAAAMTLLAGVALAQDDKVVATINGQPVTEADLAITIADLDQQFAQLPAEQRRAAALSALIEIRLLSAEAESKGLADGDEFQQRMAMLRQRALHSAYIDSEIAEKVTAEAVRAMYDKQIAEMPATNEVRARHIIVPTQEEAAAIIEELKAGGNFEEIAKAKSQDGAAAQGGDLGYFAAGQMVPEFETAAFAMNVGDYSQEPVKTQFGWHVIKIEDKRVQQPPAFEQVEGQFRSLLLRQTYFDTVKALREAAAVEISDPELKKALEATEAQGEEATEQE